MEISLSENDEKYLKSRNLYEEILITRNLIEKNTTSLQLFSEIKKKTNIFLNINIDLRVLLTIPHTSVGAERTFLKLKIIKKYIYEIL